MLYREKNAGTPVRVTITGSFLGLKAGQYTVTDVWSGQTLGYHDLSKSLTLYVPPMGVRFLRYNIVKITGHETESGKNSCNVVNPGMSGWLMF